jgi:hypothetical protein
MKLLKSSVYQGKRTREILTTGLSLERRAISPPRLPDVYLQEMRGREGGREGEGGRRGVKKKREGTEYLEGLTVVVRRLCPEISPQSRTCGSLVISYNKPTKWSGPTNPSRFWPPSLVLL